MEHSDREIRSVQRVPIEIQGFGGINTLHSRNPGQSYQGKNYITKHGDLYSRGGSDFMEGVPGFSDSIRTIHTLPRANLPTPRFLVEAGTSLWLFDGDAWSCLKDDLGGTQGLSSTLWATPFGDSYAVLVNGVDSLVYNIAENTLTDLVNLDLADDEDENGDDENGEKRGTRDDGVGAVPQFRYVTTWRGFVWGWNPEGDSGHLIRFSGFDKDTKRHSIDYWPMDFAIDPSGNAGETVLSCIPFQTHMMVITDKGWYTIYGYGPDNFEPSPGGHIGAYGPKCSVKIGDNIIWLGRDRQRKVVYTYTGTTAFPISPAIDDLLQDETGDPEAFGIHNIFYLRYVREDENEQKYTRLYLYDLLEQEWFIHEYPIELTHGAEYLANPIFGTQDKRLLVLGVGETDLGEEGPEITTEFSLGPIASEGRVLKGKSLYLIVEAEEQEGFSLDIYTTSDQKDEVGPRTIEFTQGRQDSPRIRLRGTKGRNIMVRFVTQDNVKRIRGATITIVPKKVK